MWYAVNFISNIYLIISDPRLTGIKDSYPNSGLVSQHDLTIMASEKRKLIGYMFSCSIDALMYTNGDFIWV